MSRPWDASRDGGDASLLAACLVGDEQAWATLVERYTRLIFSIARKSGLNEEDAADVVQNVFTIVLRRLEALQQPERFSSWLITTSHRESWRVGRGRLDTSSDDAIEPVDPQPPTDHQVIELEHATLVQEAVRQLDDRCRQLIESLFLADDRPSYDEISQHLGIAVGSIGPIRARCLKRLRAQLQTVGVVDASV